MIQTNVPEAPAKVKRLINRPDSVDVLFANGSSPRRAATPSALVRRNIANGGMTNEDLDGGFLQPVRSREDIDRVWSARIKKQRPRLHQADACLLRGSRGGPAAAGQRSPWPRTQSLTSVSP